jgi:hypothetical protein
MAKTKTRIVKLDMRQTADPDRVIVAADVVDQAVGAGKVEASVKIEISIADKPDFDEIQARVLEVLAQAFAPPVKSAPDQQTPRSAT